MAKGEKSMRFLAEKFKADRLNKGITQTELSELTGVSVSTIKNIEANKRSSTTPEDINLKLLCDKLGTNPEEYFKRDCTIIAVQCHKGGCGKTTTTINVAYSLAKLGNRVLVIDTDSQLNLTVGLGQPFNLPNTFYTSFVNRTSLQEQIRPTEYENIDIITNHTSSANLDMHIFILDRREYIMQEILREIKEKGEYDYILIDCATALNQLNKSILYASDEVLIPVEPSKFGTLGLHDLYSLYKTVKKDAPNLNLLGIVITQFAARETLQQSYADAAADAFEGEANVLQPLIPKDANIKKSQSYNKPIGAIFPRSRATQAYMELAKQIVETINSRGGQDE